MADPKDKKDDDLDSVLGVGSDKKDSDHKLEDIDPLFGKEDKEHSDKKIDTEPNTNVPEAGAAGAAGCSVFVVTVCVPSARVSTC